jgi:hypothetical protein
MTVLMELILAKHGHGVSLVEDQNAFEQLPADGADEAFSDRVWPGVPAPEFGRCGRQWR